MLDIKLLCSIENESLITFKDLFCVVLRYSTYIYTYVIIIRDNEKYESIRVLAYRVLLD